MPPFEVMEVSTIQKSPILWTGYMYLYPYPQVVLNKWTMQGSPLVRLSKRYSAGTVLLLGLGTVKCEDTGKIYIRIIYTQPPAPAPAAEVQCAVLSYFARAATVFAGNIFWVGKVKDFHF